MRGHPGHVVASTYNLILHRSELAGGDVPQRNLLTLDDHHAIYDPGVLGSPVTTPAQRLDLQRLDPVGQLDHPLGPGEQGSSEIGGDAEGVHIHTHLVHDAGELLDLNRGVELRFVADQVVNSLAPGGPADDDLPEVEIVNDLDRARGQAKTRGKHRLAGAVVLGEYQPGP